MAINEIATIKAAYKHVYGSKGQGRKQTTKGFGVVVDDDDDVHVDLPRVLLTKSRRSCPCPARMETSVYVKRCVSRQGERACGVGGVTATHRGRAIHCAGLDKVSLMIFLPRPAGTAGARKATAGAQANAKPKETTRMFAGRVRVCVVVSVWGER